MSLLPSRPDASPAEDAGPRVVDVESDDADDVFDALSSETARQLLTELHAEPAAPSMLAEATGTTVQNVQYHLDKLEQAGAIEVVETAYSEKGREMDVYAPADQPLVIFAGDEDDRGTLRTAISRLLGSVGILALASLAIQSVFGESLVPWTDDAADGGGDDVGEAADGASESPGEDGGTADGGGAGADGGTDGGTESGSDTGDGGQALEDERLESGSDDTGGADGDLAEADASDDAADGADGAQDAAEPDQFAEAEPPSDGDLAEESGNVAADAGDAAANASANATGAEGNVSDGVQTATDAAASLPPGLLFFAGGLLVLALVIGYLYLQDRRLSRPT